jgi:hypothetical protein
VVSGFSEVSFVSPDIDKGLVKKLEGINKELVLRVKKVYQNTKKK